MNIDDFHLNTDLKFPVGLKGEIVFNEETIRMICQLVGIDLLQIKTTDGKTEVSIGRIASDGTAAMGQTAYKPESTSNLNNFNLNDFLDYASFHYSNAEINIDLEQLYNEMLTANVSYAEARNSEIWAKKLNVILKKELLRLIYLKQKSNVSNAMDYLPMFFVIVVMFTMMKDLFTIKQSLELLEQVGWNAATLLSLYGGRVITSAKFKRYKNRFSILFPYGLELDRALAASFLALWHDLVSSKEA